MDFSENGLGLLFRFWRKFEGSSLLPTDSDLDAKLLLQYNCDKIFTGARLGDTDLTDGFVSTRGD